MKLYIMRHGEAQAIDYLTHHDDAQRLLTKQGELEARMMANWLMSMDVVIDTILVSPYKRAQQTCAQVMTAFTKTSSMHFRGNEAITVDLITPSGDAQQVHDYIDGFIAEYSEHKAILMVSHMPLVSYLVAKLTHSNHAPIFPTAGIVEIDYDTNAMKGEFIRQVSPLDLC